MAVHHRLATTDEGRPLLVKRADRPADVLRLVHEAALLRASAHPGVVAVVEERDLDDGYELHLAVAGPRTVADLRVDLGGVAGLVSALAATVADLHELGIVHGRIRAEHVVVDGSGRPVLCGFGGAGRVGDDPADGGPPLAGADDVAGLGALLAELVARASGPSTPRWRWTTVARRGAGGTGRALLALAEQATDAAPNRRPSARAFSAAVLAALPAARLPVPGATDEVAAAGRSAGSASWSAKAPGERVIRRVRWGRVREDRSPANASVVRPADDAPAGNRAWRRWAAPVAAAVGLGLLAFGVGGLLRPAPTARQAAGDRSAAPVAGASTTSTTAPAADATSTTAPAATSAVPSGGVGPEAEPAMLEHDGVRYAVGRSGDVLVVGDWDCDGQATAAVVRPVSGEVFVFDRWAAAGTDATAELVATVAGAASAAAEDADADGCPTLVVADSAGRRHEVTA